MIKDCRIFGTIPDNVPDDIVDEILFEFKYTSRSFLFCRPPIDLSYLKGLNFGFRTGDDGPMAVIESIFPQKIFTTGLCIIKYDFEKHLGLKKEERYLHIMNLMEEGIKPYASHLGLDMSFFNQTFKRMREMGFKGCSFILDPVKSSKDRKYKASMEVEFSENLNTFNIIFLDKSDQVVKRLQINSVKLPSRSDNSGTLFSPIGRWRWLSNEEFVMFETAPHGVG